MPVYFYSVVLIKRKINCIDHFKRNSFLSKFYTTFSLICESVWRWGRLKDGEIFEAHVAGVILAI